MIILDRLKSMKAEPRLACNLECIGELQSEHLQEYCGPVKIIVVQKPEERYLMKKWSTACYAYANICIGGLCVATSLHDAVRTEVYLQTKVHAVSGIYGLLFFSSFGMMNMNFDYGGSYNVKEKQVRRQHFLFHVVGLLLSTLSWFCSGNLRLARGIAWEKVHNSGHSDLCRLALICGAVAFGMGIFFSRIFKGTKKNAMHVMFGAVAYFWYCICAVTGEYDWPNKIEPRHEDYHNLTDPTIESVDDDKNSTYNIMNTEYLKFKKFSNNYFGAFTILLIATAIIILYTSATYMVNLCRESAKKLRPVCLDEKQLALDAKKREKDRAAERKRRDLLKIMGKQSEKKYDTQLKS